MTTNWQSLIHSKGSLTEQNRRERNGTKHRETMAINAEIAGDSDKRITRKREKMSFEAINQAIKANRAITAYNAKRMAFGPRLVLPDGTCRYSFK